GDEDPLVAIAARTDRDPRDLAGVRAGALAGLEGGRDAQRSRADRLPLRGRRRRHAEGKRDEEGDDGERPVHAATTLAPGGKARIFLSPMAVVEWTGDGLRLIDQTRLPDEESYVLCTDAASVARAIRDMVVRGAPAIGVTAAYGAAMAVREGR